MRRVTSDKTPFGVAPEALGQTLAWGSRGWRGLQTLNWNCRLKIEAGCIALRTMVYCNGFTPLSSITPIHTGLILVCLFGFSLVPWQPLRCLPRGISWLMRADGATALPTSAFTDLTWVA